MTVRILRRGAIASSGDWRVGPPPNPPPGDAGRTLVPATGAYLGASPNVKGSSGVSQATLATLEAQTQRTLRVVRLYAPNGIWQPWFQAGSLEKVLGDAGYYVAWSAKYGRYSGGVKTNGFSWAEVAAGTADATLQARANEMAAFNKPVFICFHHESDTGDVNGVDHPTYGLASDFAAAWRRAYGIFRVTCPKAIFVLNYGGYKTHVQWWQNSWPGDSYVDWIAGDHYAASDDGSNPIPTQQVSSTFRNWMNVTKPGRHDFPWAIWESGARDDAGATGVKKKAWFLANLAWFKTFPQLKMYLYWNDHSAGPDPDQDMWVDTSPLALEGWVALANDPWFFGVAAPQVPGFVGAAALANNSSNISVTAPSDVVADDVMLLALSTSGQANITDPAGWTLLDTQTDGTSFTSKLYWRRATGPDAGATISVTTALAAVHNALSLTVWRGIDPLAPIHAYSRAAEGAVSQATHTAPLITTTVTTRNLEIVADKVTPGTADLAPSAGTTIRSEAYQAGQSGAVSIAVGDRTEEAAGSVGGHVWTADQASAVAAMWTVALAPADSQPPPPPSGPAFRDASGNANNGTTIPLTIPSTTVVGDLLLMALSTSGQAGIVDPAGWTLLDTVSDGTSFTEKVWTRVAQAGDAGSTVTVTTAASAVQNAGGILVYSGIDAATPVHMYAKFAEGATAKSAHTTPTINTTLDAMILEFVGDKFSPGSSTWAVPGGFFLRVEQYRVTGGGVSAGVADRGVVGPGTRGGHDWVADQSTAVAGMWTIALKPA